MLATLVFIDLRPLAPLARRRQTVKSAAALRALTNRFQLTFPAHLSAFTMSPPIVVTPSVPTYSETASRRRPSASASGWYRSDSDLLVESDLLRNQAVQGLRVVPVVFAPSHDVRLHAVQCRRAGCSASVKLHVQGLQMLAGQLCRHVLCEQIRRVLLTEHLLVRDSTGYPHFLDPQALSPEMSNFPDAGPLRDPQRGRAVTVELARHVDAKIPGVGRHRERLGGRRDHGVQFRFGRAESNDLLLLAVRLDHVLSDAYRTA